MIAALTFLLIGQTKPVDKTPPVSYQLRYFEGEFILRTGRSAYRARVPATPTPPLTSVAFRKDDKWAVWDERGLTIRVGDKVTSTKLNAIATSPRIFERSELVDSIARMKRGERSPFADGLAGSRRVGNDVFFVPRWLDSKKQTWLEALVKVDLSRDLPKPELVARIPGLTVQHDLMDRWLTVDDAGLHLPVRRAKEWALLTINGAKIDEAVQDAELLDLIDDRYVQKLPSGLQQYGDIDWKSRTLDMKFESRGKLTIPPFADRLLLVKEPTAASAVYLPTGAVWTALDRAEVVPLGPFFLFYRPDLSTAVAVDAATGKRLATYSGSAKK
jgi:hypothetical protein